MGERPGEGGLTHTGNVLEQHVTFSEHAHHGIAKDLVLALDGLGRGLHQRFEPLGKLGHVRALRRAGIVRGVAHWNLLSDVVTTVRWCAAG